MGERRTLRRGKVYGVASSHADEDTLPTTSKHGFFQRGREFESAHVNHSYTQEEREKLATFESVDYLPPHSTVYKVKLSYSLVTLSDIYIAGLLFLQLTDSNR